ncbi:ImmA/IrrE family metallo-endopeptidase [Bifidobacterium callimiconis]|uniref:IrrE N-terminal-like domain-containing protein n=1 Tax=Bifidobacterium callimiconis TaxID=2306973 RepID=A0A430FIL7_9BIFI|nr:ImmA/IrrE family metallo-endopeptidase [Bifidobacterium callimiconis]RSX52686.1 IrrE N-terminal-like domain-containing protein [Bifidobacterium callimiconis]
MAKLVWQDARERAQNVLDNYWDGRFPVKIATISRAMGVTPYQASLPAGVSGMVVKKPKEPARSYVESSESETRRRFTLAHELGHYVERVEVSDDDDFSFAEKREPGRYDLHEFYADEFAGALLMPEEHFLNMLDEGRSLIDIAAKFGVSLDAARKRRERLEKNPPQKD